MKRLRLALPLLLALVVLFTGEARAEDATRVAAREYFKQGVALFDQRRFADALAQFEQSYALYPAHSTLRNIGQVSAALGRPVEAVDAFEKYLVQGGASVTAEQRAQVEAELEAQRQRVGDLALGVTPAGVDVRVDGTSVGKAPFTAPVRIAVGHHRVEALLDGYRSEMREVDVAGQGHAQLVIELQKLELAPALALVPVPAHEAALQQTAPATTVQVVMPRQASGRTASNAGPSAASGRTASADVESRSTGTTQRVLGYGVAGLGLIGGGVGIALAVDGQSKHDEALRQWTAGDKDGARETESRSADEKTLGFVTIGIGGAVVLTGAVVLLTAPPGSSGRARWSVSPWVADTGAGTSVEGVW